MNAKQRLWVLFFVLFGACTARNPAPVHTNDDDLGALMAGRVSSEVAADNRWGLQPADNHYGVYLNGHKVGWMRSTVTLGDPIEMSLQLEAAVGGMGTVSEIHLEESRTYRPSDGALLAIRFEQRAATGTMRATGQVENGVLKLSVEAGQKVTESQHPVEESLEDSLATLSLAKKAEVGGTATASRFDPSILKTVTAQHRVAEVAPRVLGGVSTQTVRIESTYPSLGIAETQWMDVSGTVLESKVGGFFVARLEPPDQAKRREYSQDLLVSAVVKAPPEVAKATEASTLELEVHGFGDQLPPDAPRQRVSPHKEGAARIVLTRDAPIGRDEQAGSSTAYLDSTPFIQSDAPAIREKALEVVGDAKDVATQVQRLTSFVFTHVKDEYVPSYSNALEALQSGRGDCTEHSILFVALARALNIPARVAVGIAYWPAGAGFGWHAWAEVELADRWVAVDPTWNQPVADVTHVKLADGGPAEQARIVMLLGSLRIVDAKVGT